MVAIARGFTDWSLSIDKDGHRDYRLLWEVDTTSNADGPAVVANAAGLPTVGTTWAFGNDVDLWAFCWPNWVISPVLTKEANRQWTVEQVFSTKPLNRCQDNSIENPLLEPDRINGSFVRYVKEVTQDRFGEPLKTSSHELIRGAIAEFDHNRPTVTVEKNLASLPLVSFAPMIDSVNDATLWGLPARCVKLSNASWRRHLYGTCTYYYTVTYEFDIDYYDFDRKAIDEGTKVLSKGGDKTKPQDFELYKDRNGENTRVLLDGNGEPLKDDAEPVEIDISYYRESNLMTLGIPASL